MPFVIQSFPFGSILANYKMRNPGDSFFQRTQRGAAVFPRRSCDGAEEGVLADGTPVLQRLQGKPMNKEKIVPFPSTKKSPPQHPKISDH
ncbi:hypothetical protein SKAU_G00180720 [Synaphobranchus kaupii]|uniref:Uncharacterized protein n=1 Tax=Synaphobranchus kaupii TaxID=118154 RepID=A0A9Q1J1R6_SYNKA|nr:hypothetical protein SKAU_G00180720 [Synaphobranchus kaupii]